MENQTNQTTITNQPLQAVGATPLTPPPPIQPIPESPKKNYVTTLVIILILALIGMGGLTIYFWQKSKTVPPVVSEVIPTQLPTLSPSPQLSPIVDVTANWKTYNNLVQNYSFKYANDWKVDSGSANEDPNSLLVLARNGVKVTIYANLVGIGGVGRDYNGTPVSVSGVNLYQYDNTQSDTTTLGVTDTLKRSLGVFQRNNKTYQITMTFPASYKESELSDKLRGEYYEILSTFKFTDRTQVITSNWKTYTSIKYNYSISYPISAQLVSEGDFKVFVSGKEYPSGAYISVYILENPKNLALRELGNQTYSTECGYNLHDLGWHETVLFGEKVLIADKVGGCGDAAPQTIYLLEKNGVTYSLSRSVMGKSDPETLDLSELSNQILSTFKFTK